MALIGAGGTPSKHVTPDQVCDRMTILVYELNQLLRIAPQVGIKATVDYIDTADHTRVLVTVGKR